MILVAISPKLWTVCSAFFPKEFFFKVFCFQISTLKFSGATWLFLSKITSIASLKRANETASQ